MSPFIESIAVTAALLLTGVIGGWVSKAVRLDGWNPAWSYLTTPITASIWVWQVKWGSLPLTKASALYDVMLALSWFAAYAYFGETVTTQQWAGVALLCVGLALVNA